MIRVQRHRRMQGSRGRVGCGRRRPGGGIGRIRIVDVGRARKPLRQDIGGALGFKRGLGSGGGLGGGCGLQRRSRTLAAGQVAAHAGRRCRAGAGHDQHLFQAVQVGGGFQDHIHQRRVIGVRHNLVHDADRQPARKHLVPARGQHQLARLDAVVRHQADDFRMAHGVATQDAAGASLLEQHTGSAGAVRNFKHLACVCRHLADAPDHAVRRHHRHLGRNAVVRTFVDVQDALAV